MNRLVADFSDMSARGLVLLGCGKMGSAMLEGWLNNGFDPKSVHVLDPMPSQWLLDQAARGVVINGTLPSDPAVVLIAVKPQMMGNALPQMARLGNGRTVFLSIAAGTPIRAFEEVLGAKTPIVRAMPNTPAAIGQGISAIIGNCQCDAAALDVAALLLGAVGDVVTLENEGQMDAVTALSGSGPAYVFHMIEAMTAAGAALGLPVEMALQLARKTVSGAGAYASQSGIDPAELRVNVTSPGGTTAAALNVLMDAQTGLPPLMARAITAASDRSKELAKKP